MAIVESSKLCEGGLNDWLNIATAKLVPAAAERIRSEITAHYAEAENFHLESGASPEAAAARALAELGDAHAALRRFRREHFTTSDLKYLHQVLKKSRDLLNLLSSVFLALVFGMMLVESKLVGFPLVGAFILLDFSSLGASFILSSKKELRKHLAMIVLFNEAKGNVINLYVVAMIRSSTPLTVSGMVLLFCMLKVVPVVRAFRFLRKRRNLGEVPAEPPTPATAS